MSFWGTREGIPFTLCGVYTKTNTHIFTLTGDLSALNLRLSLDHHLQQEQRSATLREERHFIPPLRELGGEPDGRSSCVTLRDCFAAGEKERKQAIVDNMVGGSF